MKRFALIVGSPLSPQGGNHLPGAERDIEMYYHFLLSSTGGGWERNEITVLRNPSLWTLQRHLLAGNGADISYLIFSGHGFSNSGSQFLNINDSEVFPLQNFSTSARVQIRIIDACRNESRTYSGIGGLQGLGFNTNQQNRQIAREMFEQGLNSVPRGTVTVSSTQWNKSAIDTPEGGAFTLALMSSLSDWGGRTKQGTMLTLSQALSCSQKVLNFRGQEQQINYSGNEQVLLNLKLAFDSEKHRLQQTKQRPAASGSGGLGWFLGAAFTVVLADALLNSTPKKKKRR